MTERLRQDDPESSHRLMTPLQAELLESGILPPADEVGATMQRVGMARDVGYGEAGPDPLPSPEASSANARYAGWPPVFQWEIDPTDSTLESGEVSVTQGDWEYEIWFQVHPVGLVYASIQALCEDPAGGPERQHPVGRNVAVNLVYDRRRGGVVAIYGTARDFRPFVEAFRTACGLEQGEPPAQETNS